jgi:hypothetical protein
MKRKPEETMKMLERNKTMLKENKKSPAKKVRPLVKITSPKGMDLSGLLSMQFM